VEKRPQHAELEQLYLEQLQALGRKEAAAKLLEGRLDRDPSDGWAQQELALLQAQQAEQLLGAPREALLAKLQATQRWLWRQTPDHPISSLLAAFLAVADGRPQAAVEVLLQAIERTPSAGQLYGRLAALCAALPEVRRRALLARLEERLAGPGTALRRYVRVALSRSGCGDGMARYFVALHGECLLRLGLDEKFAAHIESNRELLSSGEAGQWLPPGYERTPTVLLLFAELLASDGWRPLRRLTRLLVRGAISRQLSWALGAWCSRLRPRLRLPHQLDLLLGLRARQLLRRLDDALLLGRK